MKCKRETDGRSIDKAAMPAIRLQAVKAVRNGQMVEEVARSYGVSVRTVFRWLGRFASGGQNALRSKPKSGRPPKLTPEQLEWLAKAIRDKTPQQMKMPYALWTLSIIRDVIKMRFKTTVSIATVGSIMRRLGFSPQKPLYQAWQQDAVLVREWEQTTYPEIRKEAKAVGATVYFADEAGLRSDDQVGRTWGPVGQTPVVEKTGRRFSINMLSAVGPRGECRFMVHQGTVNGAVFKTFLQRLLVGAKAPVYVIVDGHPAHRSKIVKSFVESTDGKLKLYFLPPYSPHLNPDEQVWAHVKREVSKQTVQTLDQMKRLAISALRRIQKLPALVRSFFKQPECQYILK
jgi:transposase